MFYQGTNVPAVQESENWVNLEEPKQGQDTDMNITDADCWAARADVSSYFYSGGHGKGFLITSSLLFFFFFFFSRTTV